MQILLVSLYTITFVSIQKHHRQDEIFCQNEETRSIKHFTFKMWNDHLQLSCELLVLFVQNVKQKSMVHCRSGTFIVRCREEMVQNEVSQIYCNTFSHLIFFWLMIQHQYLFIHRCLREEQRRTTSDGNHVVIADDLI